MKMEPEVKAEIRKMARDSLILSVLTALAFLAFGKLNMAAVYGLLIGYAMVMANFILLSIAATRAVDSGDETAAKRIMLGSRIFRTVLMLGVMGVCVWIWTRSERIHWIPVVAAAFHPFIIFTARGWIGYFLHRKDPASETTDRTEASPLPDADEDGEEEDEFEKFVGRFAKGPVPGSEKQPDDKKKQDPDGNPGPGPGTDDSN
ncbi:MAG: ATP synthase subunit I [Clostridia bacterium]|nr:ATP synthase subunit I [Clostridia bacterium]